MSAGQIVLYLGALLIAVGIGLTVFQMIRQGPPGQMRSASLNRRGVTIKTTYPGIVLIGIGALLVLIGTVAN